MKLTNEFNSLLQRATNNNYVKANNPIGILLIIALILFFSSGVSTNNRNPITFGNNIVQVQNAIITSDGTLHSTAPKAAQ